MTKYQQRSFTVPAVGGNVARATTYCAEHGHTMPDVRGKCLRCAAKVRHAVLAQVAEHRPRTAEVAGSTPADSSEYTERSGWRYVD